MGGIFARGTWAYGNCDRCAQRWPLNELKFEVRNQVLTKTRTCPDCFDPDHPQNRLGRLKIRDPQALIDARPEVGIENSRGLFGWSPVGHEYTYTTVSIGTVTITTS